MALITMTEALAELKTLTKRLVKKREALMPYLWRQEGLKDPMEKEEGGSMGYIQRERQSIQDLETRFVAIRTAIQRANQEHSITINGVTRTMAEWLNWRKEIAQEQQHFIAAMRKNLLDTRKAMQAKGYAVIPPGGTATTQLDILVNVDEKALADEAEAMETILGTLDGQLSLKLATIAIDM